MKKILIIEDEHDWLNQIIFILNSHFDFEIESYSSFELAEDRLVENSGGFDLLITDVYASKKAQDRVRKGIEFAEFVHELNKTPVIVVTGDSSIVKSSLKNKNILDVFDKGNFDRLDFIRLINKTLKQKERKNEISEDSNFIIEEIDLGTKNILKKARLLIYQFSSTIELWEQKEGLFYPKDFEFFRKCIFKVLEIANIEKINLVVFPELSIPELFIPEILEWSKSRSNLIIVGGSHYYTKDDKTISRSPIFALGKVFFTEKIFPSPNELSPILGNGIQKGSKITYFTNSIIGNFFVLICSDNLMIQKIRAKVLGYNPDFIIVPAFQKDSKDHHIGMSDSVNNCSDLYYVYSNNNFPHLSDGRSAFFGIVRKEVKDELIKYNKTDFNPKGKLCELKDKEEYCLIEVDIKNKNPSAKRKVGDEPNVIVKTF